MKKFVKVILASATVAAALVSCTSNKAEGLDGVPELAGDRMEAGGTDYPYSEPSSQQGNAGQAGVVTAGEWNDLDHWDFWSNLAQNGFKDYISSWGFNTEGRVAVRVTDEAGVPVCGVPVVLLDGSDAPLWRSRTDNYGKAECWTSMFSDGATSSLKLSVNGEVQEDEVKVSWLQEGESKVNEFTLSGAKAPEMAVDIAFIVDATGSMADEIDFLKQDITNIIDKVMQSQSGMKIRTGAIFYRDVSDEYLTVSSNFNEELGVTRKFIQAQGAEGGGDYPEAVHTALECSLQELSWNSSAHARIAFMILDAPAHEDDAVKASLHESISSYAQAGIKLIPIAASGVDKNTEAMLRLFSICTNSTYVFITNDSGVGGDHIEATVGDYEVEKLNELIIRLINYYSKVVSTED